jgi:hypothetical protein
MATWVEGWSDPHVVQTGDTTWELRSSSDYCLGIIEQRDGGYWGIQPGQSKFFMQSLEGTAQSLFDRVVRGKERKARALPPVGDPYWKDAPKSSSRRD